MASGSSQSSQSFLILGTDGLWDVVDNQEASNVVEEKIAVATDVGAPKGIDAACRGLVDLARTRGSRDDIKRPPHSS